MPDSDRPEIEAPQLEVRRAMEAQRSAERAQGLRGCFWSFWALLALAIAGAWYFLSNLTWTKGRPLRGRRRGQQSKPAGRAETAEARAANHWRRMAQEEFESIAAFAELALDLMAAGAPTELVTRSHQAALEEARHTQACLSIASGLDGDLVPLTTPSRLLAVRRRPRWRAALLVRLAVESYFDGWVGEASSARVLAQLAREARDPRIRDALRQLAREEMGHARLGADIVRWCTHAGGPLVEHALAIARRHAVRPDLSPGASAAAENLRYLGVPDAELRAAALQATHAAVLAASA
jgi:hypothetical protein